MKSKTQFRFTWTSGPSGTGAKEVSWLGSAQIEAQKLHLRTFDFETRDEATQLWKLNSRWHWNDKIARYTLLPQEVSI